MNNTTRSIILALAMGATVGQAEAQCVTTLFAANNGGAVDGAIYFDVTLTAPITTFVRLESNLNAAAGASVGMDVFVTPVTHVGNELDPTVWTLVSQDDGQAIAPGVPDVPTCITLTVPINLVAGTYGFALVAEGAGHHYTNGTNTFTAPGITTTHGSANNIPFTSNVFSPRTWNGRLCTGGACGNTTIGTSFCDPALQNSTGLAGHLSATGSLFVADNDLTLTLDSIPLASAVLFLVSTSQTMHTFTPPSLCGSLCIGGGAAPFSCPLGHVGPFIQVTSTGTLSSTVDLTSVCQWEHCPGGGLFSALAGIPLYFQALYTDYSVAGWQLKFSNAVCVDFQ